jgi:3-hydroxyacyl-[acyl-carrier-protein] dehydratase
MDSGTQTAAPAKKGKTVELERIMEMIPHRSPFLFIDRVVDIVTGESATGVKNVTVNEPFFEGHFPGHPVMPGVLIVECMAQTAAVVVVDALGKGTEGKLVYFMSVESARFRRPVVPGDTLRIHVRKERSRGAVWKFSAQVKVEEAVVADAAFTAMIREDT